MKKAELEVGAAYRTKYGTGPQTLVSLQATDATGRTRPGRVTLRDARGGLYSESPRLIVCRWDDPEEVAKRERRAKAKAQALRAIALAERIGLTVTEVDRPWSSQDPAQARVTGNHERISIDVAAFLAHVEPLTQGLARSDGGR